MNQWKFNWQFICYTTAKYGLWFGLKMAGHIVTDSVLEWLLGESLFDRMVDLRIQRLVSQIPEGRRMLEEALKELRREIC